MAIKGKGKTRTRQVARAPRHEPVEVKPPLLMRRWVQLVGACVAGVLVVLIAIWVTNGLRSDRAKHDATAQASAQREAGTKWKTELEGQIRAAGGSVVPDSPTAPTMFTSVGDAITGLQKGQPPAHAADALSKAEDAAATGNKALTGFALSDAVRGKGFDVATVNYFLNSQQLIAQSFELYRQAASLAALALDATGAEQKTLAKHAADLKASADQLFAQGWSAYQQALYAAHVVQTPLGAPGGAGS